MMCILKKLIQLLLMQESNTCLVLCNFRGTVSLRRRRKKSSQNRAVIVMMMEAVVVRDAAVVETAI